MTMQGDAQQPAAMTDERAAFEAWASDKGYDTAHTYDTERSRWVWLNPMTADLWQCWQARALLAAQAQPQVPDGCKAEADCQWHPWCKDKCLAAAPPVPAQAAPSMEAPEPAEWQWRWLNPGKTPNVQPDEFAWQPVETRDASQTLQQRLDELRAYRFRDKPCYEVRALYAHPTTAAPAGVPSDEHRQLMKFYGVSTLGELVATQARSIERLQERLRAAEKPFSFAPQRVREG